MVAAGKIEIVRVFCSQTLRSSRLRGVGEIWNILLQAWGASAPSFRAVGSTGYAPGVAHLFHSYAGKIYQQHRADKKRRGEQQGK
jgi:hypothetical protein